MTTNELKQEIIETFDRDLGFSPSKKSINMLEIIEDSYTQVDFHVNGIQYRFSMDNYGTSREIIRL